jgi:hypothetical protein
MAELRSQTYDVADAWAWLEMAYERRWTDGLPVAPPTPERVQAVLDYLQRDPQEVIGLVPPREGVATIEKIAINCVMAGCKPEYVPVVLAALEAMLEPPFNLNGVQTTTNPCAPLVIVSGPAVERLGFNVNEGVFGGGSRANAAIGRAVRLIMWNIGGAYPGDPDMATLGHPGKYAYCIAENHPLSPWEPLHVERGLAPDQSAVTVFACDPPHTIYVPGTARRILRILAHTLPTPGVNMFHCAGQYLLVFSVKPAQELARAGFAKREVKRYLYEYARFRWGDLQRWGVLNPDEQVGTYWGGVEDAPWATPLDDDQLLPMVQSADDIHVVCAGGTGQWWVGFCPGWGNYGGYAVTKPIRWPDEG